MGTEKFKGHPCNAKVVEASNRMRAANLAEVGFGMKLKAADRDDGKGCQGEIELKCGVDAVLGHQPA